MKTLTPKQMDAVRDTAPVALKSQDTPTGIVSFVVTPVDDGFAVSSAPFEVIGAPEVHEAMSVAIARMLECARAVANDQFPPIHGEQVAA